MEILFEVLKVILPAIISGFFTFIVTKYTYNRNQPLDKLETAYDKVYYPLYKLVYDSDYSNEIDILINKSKRYFKIYGKYIDFSTLKAFNYLCKSNKGEEKNAYQNFKNNICDRSTYLRRRLGYLEPNFAQIYKYSAPSSKSLFRIMIEISIIYITLIVCGITMNNFAIIYNIFICVFVIVAFIVLCEFVVCIFRFLKGKIIGFIKEYRIRREQR